MAQVFHVPAELSSAPAWTALAGRLDTAAATLAVVGFVGIAWLLGLLIVVAFWVARGEPE